MAEKALKKEIKKTGAPKKVAAPAKEKSSVKAEVKVAAKKETVVAKLQAEVVSVKGAKSGSISLPSEVFGVRVNKPLIAQAVRVYLANQRSGSAHAKTRAEVSGTTKKVWRQKGTGRARHGSAKGPIFVGGGITHGPRTRDFSLDMPQKMRKAALFSALSSQFKEKKITFIDPEGLTSKTKTFSQMLKSLSLLNKKGKANSVLIVLDKENSKLYRAGRNIEGMRVERVQDLTTYRVVENKHIVIMKNAVSDFNKKETK